MTNSFSSHIILPPILSSLFFFYLSLSLLQIPNYLSWIKNTVNSCVFHNQQEVESKFLVPCHARLSVFPLDSDVIISVNVRKTVFQIHKNISVQELIFNRFPI
jgi:hypothetical protein